MPPVEQQLPPEILRDSNSIDPIDHARELLKVAFEETGTVEPRVIPAKLITGNTMPEFNHKKAHGRPTDNPVPTPPVGENTLSLDTANPDERKSKEPQASSRPTYSETLRTLGSVAELGNTMNNAGAGVLRARKAAAADPDFALAA